MTTPIKAHISNNYEYICISIRDHQAEPLIKDLAKKLDDACMKGYNAIAVEIEITEGSLVITKELGPEDI